MKELDLCNYKLTELSESDLIQFCELNEIEFKELNSLDLSFNNLTNINFIQPNTPFINLEYLNLGYNKEIIDINNLNYLTNLKYLIIDCLELKSEKETVNLLKSLKNLKEISCYKTFKYHTKKILQKILTNIKIDTTLDS